MIYGVMASIKAGCKPKRRRGQKRPDEVIGASVIAAGRVQPERC
jgi:hypothetical protein